jgi:DNA-binding PadR family transcriptional regulator
MERELLLLGLLRQQEMHGYQLYEFIEQALAVCTDIKKSTAYYLLNKMASDGWITEQQVREGNRPLRRVYSLTPAGEAAYQRLLRANLAEFQPVYFPGDIGLAFIDDLPVDEAIALLEARREKLSDVLHQVKSAPTHKGRLQWAIQHQMQHLGAEIVWLDEILQEMQEGVS